MADKSRWLRWTGHEARTEEGRGAFKISTNKHNWKDNIWTDFCECYIESPGSVSHGVS